jgi:hypothetical protein
MRALNQEPEIVAMANALRLVGSDPVESILDFCRRKIAGWVKECGQVRTIWDLERVVCEKLNLVIHDVWSDEELDRLAANYIEEGDIIFAHLRKDLDDKTFAILIRRRSLSQKADDRYAAVIDCRGDKGPRRFFSRWHEIAHLLTLYKQMELPLHRSTLEKDPTEKLMDMIAGEIGFYDPMFEPVLATELKGHGQFTFAVVENVRSQFCPDASSQATLNACAARIKTPVIILEIGLSLKKTELKRLQSKQIELIPSKPPVPRLRVLSSMPNAAARKISMQIPRYMRVPNISILAKVFKTEAGTGLMPAEAVEDLAWWTSSDGGSLSHTQVLVQAIKAGNHVLAIISLAKNRWN